MSDAAITMIFDQGSMDKLRRTMMARQKVLNEDIRKTVQKTTMKVLTSLRAAAKVAPPKREVVEEGGKFTQEERKESFDKDQKIQAWYAAHGSAKHKRGHLPLSLYIPRKLRGGWEFSAVKSRYPAERKLLPVIGAKKLSEAQNSPQAKIKARKLARSSFTWIMGKLGSGGSAEQREIMGVASAQRYTGRIGQSVTRIGIMFENKLRYVFGALTCGRNITPILANARAMLRGETMNSLKKLKRAA